MQSSKNTVHSRGAIDFYGENKLHGWYDSASDNNVRNSFFLKIDAIQCGPYFATNYRPDLTGESTKRSGHGYKIPIPVQFLDNQIHQIQLIDVISGKLICQRDVKLTKCQNVQHLESSLLRRIDYSAYSGGKIVIVAGFCSKSQVSHSQRTLLRYFKSLGFFIIYSLATEEQNVDISDLGNLCDSLLLRQNCGYDFGSWAHAFYLYRDYFNEASGVFFLNDSIVGPINDSSIAVELDRFDFDVCGVTDSYQRGYHIQSYFWFVRQSILRSAALDEFFFYSYPVASSREEAIINFELKTAHFFLDKGYTVGTAMDMSQLFRYSYSDFDRKARKALDDFFSFLPSVYKENPVYRDNVMKIYGYYSHLIGGVSLNPSHFFWLAIVEYGFPFVKRELIIRNPTEYPFHQDIAVAFSSGESRKLLDDVIKNAPSYSAYWNR